MSRLWFILLIYGVSCFSAGAQSHSLTGVLSDGTGPATGALVTLLSPDSALVKGVATGIDGKFALTGITPGSYILRISLPGFRSRIRQVAVSADLDLGSISLKEDIKQLQEVEVNTRAVTATQDGDTSSFSARAFKVNKDASAEDLVGKMPGITMQDGKVQAQGEDVKQVLVDGQMFFGDDAAAVLRNIPAEVIEKVQVFDRKSDQAQFTGFDDGNTSKTLNIVTRAEFRNGVFGKVYGGYGTGDRYRAGGVMNRFRDRQRVTLLAMSNNVNEQNFSSEDLLGVAGGSNKSNARPGGSGRGRGSSGRSGFSDNTENFLVNIRNGISSTSAGGINYSDQWGKKTQVNGSYFLNNTINRAQTDLVRQYVVGPSRGLGYSESSVARAVNLNHRINLRIESQIDSMNSLVFKPVLSFQSNKGTSTLNGSNQSAEGVLSTISNEFGSDLRAINVSLPALYRHRFARRGRTISLDVEPFYNSSGGNNSLSTLNTFASDSAASDSVDQRSRQDKQGTGGKGEIAYTEPLGKNTALSLNYRTTFTSSGAEKNTYHYDVTEGGYTRRDSLLSSAFSNLYLSNAVGPSLRARKEKFSLNLSLMFQHATLSREEFFPGSGARSRTFSSLLPGAFLRYNISKQKNLRLSYRTSNSAPQIEQMQEVVNNSNNLQLTTGNASLGQTFQHNVTLRYTGTDTEKLTSFFFLVGGSYTDDYIGNSTIIAGRDTVVLNNVALRKGSQISYPVNIDGQFSLRGFGNYTFPLRKLRSNLNLNVTVSHNHLPALVNQQVNYSDNSNVGAGFVLSSNISERLDFAVSANPAYNIVSNSLQENLNTVYFAQNSRVRLSYSPFTWLQFQADYNNQLYNGLSDGFNQNISLLNTSVAWKFTKSRNAELRLYVFDVLNQNNSIQRNITETYIEDVETTILRRYFMLTFTWNFKRFAG